MCWQNIAGLTSSTIGSGKIHFSELSNYRRIHALKTGAIEFARLDYYADAIHSTIVNVTG